MKIEYKDADGRVMELDVSDEIGQFYLSSVEEAEKSDRSICRAAYRDIWRFGCYDGIFVRTV